MASNEPLRPREPTAVDDVRRVRERLSAECCGDVRRLAEYAERVAEKHRASLRLKPVQSPAATPDRI